MNPNSEIGMTINELDTPSLLLDIKILEQNLRRMTDFLSSRRVNLRPHAKIYRATPEIAHRQINAGAIGITCAKLSEAEILVSAGITDILVANQIVGSRKIERLVNLAKKTNIKVAVDSRENIDSLSWAARAEGVNIGVLVEVNIGHNRCGVAPYEPVLEIIKYILEKQGITFWGLMGYDGHCTLKVTEDERGPLSRKANLLLANVKKYVEASGIKVEIVSAGGTFTYRYAAEIDGITEVQAGTYLLMDTGFRDNGVREFDCALSVLTTVISRPGYPGANGLAIVDVGRKSINTAMGLPEVKNSLDAKVITLSDEHGRVVFEDSNEAPKIGEKIELWVRDANGTINQFDRFYVVRDNVVEAVWGIPLCGIHN